MSPLKSERFELRLEEDALAKIDEWRTEQEDRPTRAEAVRRLVELGLGGMSFRPADKLIVVMLSQLFRHLGIDQDINPDLLLEVLYGGHYWALKSLVRGMPTHLFHDHQDKETDVTFVTDVLDMWNFIETAYVKLSKKEKDRIAAEVDNPFGKIVRFRGFDSHHQSGEADLLHIAQFKIEKLEQFESTFGGRDLDSHVPMAPQYRRMYRVFEPMRQTLVGIFLKTDQIIQLLKAAYPEQPQK